MAIEPLAWAAMHNLLVGKPLSAVKALLKNNSGSVHLRSGAAAVIAHSSLDNEEKATLLLHALKESSGQFRKLLFFALAQVPHPSVIEELRRFADDAMSPDHLSAIETLSFLGDASIAESCYDLIKAGNKFERQIAIAAVGRVGGAENFTFLEKLWFYDSLIEDDRSQLALTLAKLNSRLVQSYLENLLCKETTHPAVILALAKLGSAAGLTQLKYLAEGLIMCNANWFRTLVSYYLGLDTNGSIEELKERVVSWVNQQAGG